MVYPIASCMTKGEQFLESEIGIERAMSLNLIILTGTLHWEVRLIHFRTQSWTLVRASQYHKRTRSRDVGSLPICYKMSHWSEQVEFPNHRRKKKKGGGTTPLES